MKIANLKLPDNYIPVFEKVKKELYETKSKIIYIYAPPAYGKTTTLLKFFQDTNFYPVFIQIEDKDRDIDTFKISLLQLLSEFCGSLKETISLIEGKEIPRLFWGILENEYKNISLPKNTYFVFHDTYYLMENFGEIIKEIILPLFKNLDAKIIIEANSPYEFEEDVKIIGNEFFTLSIEEIEKIGDLFGEKMGYEETSLLKEKTEGWILPCILFFKDKRDIKTKLRSLLEGPELLEGLLEETFKNLNEEEKISVLTLGQLKEFDYETIKWMLRNKDPERIINRLKESGFALIEEIKEGFLSFRFHRLIKSYLEEKLKKFPLGYDISFRIHLDALDYFDSVGDLENALYHAIKIRDPLRCGKYLKAIVIKLFDEGKISVIESFLKEIENEGISKTPEIIFCEGIYFYLIEEYKKSVKILKKVIQNLKEEDFLLGKYFLLSGRGYLDEKEDILLEEANKLLEEIKEYENTHQIEFDFEKDPLRIIKRKTFKSPDYFVSLMYNRVYNFCGNMYFFKKEMEKAREFYEKSLFFAKKIKDDKKIMSALHNIGITLLSEGKYEGIEYFKDIANYPALFPEKVGALNNIGLWYEIWEGDLDKAEEYYKKAIEINEKFQQRYINISFISNLTYIYLKKKKEDKVFEYLEKYEKLALSTGIIGVTNSFYLQKTEILLHLGRIKEAEETLKKIDEVEVLKSEDDKYYKMYVEGKLKYLKGEIKEAKNLINKSIEWTFLNDIFINKMERLYYLYEIYKKFNDPETIKIRKMAENFLKEKKCFKRLKDFDIEY
ncbi:MAG: tetratricopeptide repeat protein [candidate division WOR-3 bacterium]